MDVSNGNNHLIEKFELLINDWILSVQSYLWTKHRIVELDLFNETLVDFQALIGNYPQLNFKVGFFC